MIAMIFSTSGGQGPECQKYHQRLAKLMAAKKGESYSDTIRMIRQQVRFSILRTTLTAIRGFRAPTKNTACLIDIEEMDFGIAVRNIMTD